jgi:flagellar basal body rod protein FlgF
MLVWRLALTGVAAPASASIHLGVRGAASPILSPLCNPCQAVAKGHLTLTADQAQLFLKGDGYADVQAASGELTGHIVVVGHFSFSAPVRRLSR